MPRRRGRTLTGLARRPREAYTRPPLTASEPPTRRRAALRRRALVTLLAAALLIAAVAARDLVLGTAPQDPGLSTQTPQSRDHQSPDHQSPDHQSPDHQGQGPDRSP